MDSKQLAWLKNRQKPAQEQQKQIQVITPGSEKRDVQIITQTRNSSAKTVRVKDSTHLYTRDFRNCQHPRDMQVRESGGNVGTVTVCKSCGSIVNDPDLKED